MNAIVTVFRAGVDETLTYLSYHVLGCLVPAFFIAGGIAVLLSKEAIIRYFGASARRWLSYSIASVSGTILAVCSCTVLPMFAGLYKRGAGIGPATAFLYSGPAINVLAIVLTARVLGLDIGAARAFFAVATSVGVGLAMAAIFERDVSVPATAAGSARVSLPAAERRAEEKGKPAWATLTFFAILVAILLVGASTMIRWTVKLAVVSPLIGGLVALLKLYYTSDDVREWLYETWWFFRTIFPILLLGTFIIGIIGGVAAVAQGVDPLTPVVVGGKTFKEYEVAIGKLTQRVFGATTPLSCFIASVIGALLYMPTLLEVPIVGDFFGYLQGMMAPGPALALLLAGPSLSLPNMIVIWRTIGARRAAAYVALVVVLSTLLGLVWGAVVK
ncbi:MAG: permease [Candidatus Alkanophagales archaeon]|nr:MAG: permease [Candidatus Alkanophagales archaeon]